MAVHAQNLFPYTGKNSGIVFHVINALQRYNIYIFTVGYDWSLIHTGIKFIYLLFISVCKIQCLFDKIVLFIFPDKKINFEKVTETKIALQWNEVFKLEESLFSHFILTVGSAKGFSDLLRHERLRDKQYKLHVESDPQEIYVTLTAFYCTGKYTTTRQTLKIWLVL